MTQTTIDTFKEAQVPEILYKYRSWHDNLHKRLLTEREIFFASPKSFEDNEDCRNFIRFDLLTDRQLNEYYLLKSKRDNIDFTRKQHRQYARAWSKKTPFRNQELFKQVTDKMQEEYFNITGVFSMTANPSNLCLWTLYANNFKGFCVGFDSKVLENKFGSCGPVNYFPNDLPIILPEPFDTIGHIHIKRVFCKKMKWAFEEEYRLSKMRMPNLPDHERKIILDKNAFKVLVLGSELNDTEKGDIINLAINTFPSIEIKIAHKINSEVKITSATNKV